MFLVSNFFLDLPHFLLCGACHRSKMDFIDDRTLGFSASLQEQISNTQHSSTHKTLEILNMTLY